MRRNKFAKNLFLLFLVFVVLISFFNFVRLGSGTRETELSYSEFLRMVENNQISEVLIRGNWR